MIFINDNFLRNLQTAILKKILEITYPFRGSAVSACTVSPWSNLNKTFLYFPSVVDNSIMFIRLSDQYKMLEVQSAAMPFTNPIAYLNSVDDSCETMSVLLIVVYRLLPQYICMFLMSRAIGVNGPHIFIIDSILLTFKPVLLSNFKRKICVLLTAYR